MCSAFVVTHLHAEWMGERGEGGEGKGAIWRSVDVGSVIGSKL